MEEIAHSGIVHQDQQDGVLLLVRQFDIAVNPKFGLGGSGDSADILLDGVLIDIECLQVRLF